MTARLSISAEQYRTIDAAAATLRVSARDKFRHDLLCWLELNCDCRTVSNDDIQQGIAATIGIVPTELTKEITHE